VNENIKLNRFQEIIKENKGILYKVITIYCKDTEDKKDLEQEILIQLWKALDKYNDTYKISTWMYRIAMNVAISFYRKTASTISNISIDSIFIEKEYAEQDHDDIDNVKILNQFIDQLNEFDKALILLYLEDFSYVEISEIIGITETNVGSKINRIKNKLKKIHQDGSKRA
jgi:RNA polymerase sigma-70 factor (ECF subfamily)